MIQTETARVVGKEKSASQA
ncbi:hypothetical protein D039_0648A, partial [Vibrio parahaemolyticus EKP-028]